MCVRFSCANRKSKFVYSVLINKSNYEERFYSKIHQLKACLNLELITKKEIQWRRFTFDKHFVPKLRRQNQNRSSEDSTYSSKVKLFPAPVSAETNNQSDFKAFFRLTNHIVGKWKTKRPLFCKFGYQIVQFQNGSNKVAIELWVVQFWSEIILVISRKWFQTKLNSTQFNYHC